MKTNGDIFFAWLDGRQIQCSSVDDAVAIKTADALLRDGDACTDSELQRLASVLTRYDCYKAAQKLTIRPLVNGRRSF
jgi:hypothetical protein